MPDASLVRCTTASPTATEASAPRNRFVGLSCRGRAARDGRFVHALQSAFGRLPDEEVCRADKVRESLVGAAIDFPIQDQVTPL